MTIAEFMEMMEWAKEQTANINTLDNFSIATDIVKALREAEYRGYMKAVADRPQGEWIAKDGVFYCSCCNNDSAGLSEDDVYVYEIPLPNYCQDCGAKMKGAEDEA